MTEPRQATPEALGATLGAIKSACREILAERQHPDGVPFDFAEILAGNGSSKGAQRLRAAVAAYDALSATPIEPEQTNVA
jgi:hypothetical protein